MTTSPSAPCVGGCLPLVAILAAVLQVSAVPALAQQRPLVTQDPEALGSGMVLVEAGFDYGTDVFFPASGLKGNLLHAPTLGLVVGVSPIAEIELTGGPCQRLAISSRETAPLSGVVDAPGDSTSSVEDLVIGAKVRLVSEGESRPAIAFRFATKLPNSKHPSGLGLNTTDFFTGLLFGKTVQSLRLVGNIGLGILPDPVTGQRQNDVMTYGVSVTRAVTRRLDVAGEVNGRASMRSDNTPVGTESRAEARAGVRYTRGPRRVDAALILGTTSRDPAVGVTAGFTWVFKAFSVR